MEVAQEKELLKMMQPYRKYKAKKDGLGKSVAPIYSVMTASHGGYYATPKDNLWMTIYNVSEYVDGLCDIYVYCNPKTLQYKAFYYEDVFDGRTPLIEVKIENEYQKIKLDAMVATSLWNAFYYVYKDMYKIKSVAFQDEIFGEVKQDIEL